MELVCEPAFDYGREPATWQLAEDGEAHMADATGAGQTIRLATDMVLGIEGTAGARPARAGGRRPGVLLAVVGRGPGVAHRRRRRRAAAGRDRPLLAQVAGPRPLPRPPLARADPAFGSDDQGAHLHAHRRHRGRPDHLTAGDSRWRAELGLPLLVDARQHLHAAGAALPQPRLGGRRVHAVRRRPGAERGRQPPDHVRHRR